MFRSEIIIDQKSYLELVGRRAGDEELLALTLRGTPVPGQTTLASVALTKDEARLLIMQLQDWLKMVNAEKAL